MKSFDIIYTIVMAAILFGGMAPITLSLLGLKMHRFSGNAMVFICVMAIVVLPITVVVSVGTWTYAFFRALYKGAQELLT